MSSTTFLYKPKKKTFHVSLQSIHENHNYHDDTASASTSFSIHTNYTGGTDNFIPLSRLSKASFKLRSTSSFPSILNLYEHPIEEEDKGSIVKKDPSRRRKIVRYQKKVTKSDYDMVMESRNRSEQRAIKIENIARDQMEKYDKYIKNLKQKVEKQREERTRHQEELIERLQADITSEKEKKSKQHSLKRPKLVYVHDKKYIKKLPKSNFRKMVILSDELSKRGVIKNRGEMDKFWKDHGRHGPESLDVFNFNRDPIREIQETNTQHSRTDLLPPLVKKKKKKRKTPVQIITPVGDTPAQQKETEKNVEEKE